MPRLQQLSTEDFLGFFLKSFQYGILKNKTADRDVNKKQGTVLMIIFIFFRVGGAANYGNEIMV